MKECSKVPTIPVTGCKKKFVGTSLLQSEQNPNADKRVLPQLRRQKWTGAGEDEGVIPYRDQAKWRQQAHSHPVNRKLQTSPGVHPITKCNSPLTLMGFGI